MTSSLRVKLGKIEIACEGSEEFMKDSLPELVSVIGDHVVRMHAATSPARAKDKQAEGGAASLPHLIAVQEDKTQVRRFLVAAAFLQVHKDQELTTSKVVAVLKETRQDGLGNASDCLNQNIEQGLCERANGKVFFVTPAGLKKVGIDKPV
ncbi:MAG: hypothetical protein OXC53_02395 [Rhodobacteraceae bacterium]|nr:hypothetical protein [Paracoccaceae bacterium]